MVEKMKSVAKAENQKLMQRRKKNNKKDVLPNDNNSDNLDVGLGSDELTPQQVSLPFIRSQSVVNLDQMKDLSPMMKRSPNKMTKDDQIKQLEL